jgi:disulfide bond formation protein DsbB
MRLRLLLAVVAAASLLLLGVGLLMQHGLGLEPCPMCILQRYAYLAVALIAGIASLVRLSWVQRVAAALAGVVAALGAAVAGPQTWLQWHPPVEASCGRDFWGIVETFPLSRALPLILRGSGDCTKVDWSFLGLSIAAWSFLALLVLTITLWVGAFARAPRRTA